MAVGGLELMFRECAAGSIWGIDLPLFGLFSSDHSNAADEGGC